MKNKYYYLYKITNTLNGKIYIGVHRTNNLDDDYMGSGTHLFNAKSKYGIENFTKKILQQFDSEEEMYNEEAVLVDREFVIREDTYNIALGGIGNSWTPEDRIKGGKIGGKINHEQNLGIFSKKGKEKIHMWNISDANLQHILKNSKNIAESKEIQNKKKETYKKIKHQQGKNNSQYGSMWITDGVKSKKILKGNNIPNGWHKGRKIKA